MKWILGLTALALLGGCTGVKLIESSGTNIAGVGGFQGERWAIVRYLDKGSAQAENRQRAASLMREYCLPQGFVVFERQRSGGTGKMQVKFRCEGNTTAQRKAGG